VLNTLTTVNGKLEKQELNKDIAVCGENHVLERTVNHHKRNANGLVSKL